MNKKTFLSLLLDLVILAVFNILFFTIAGTEHTASVWLTYAFMHFAFLMVAATPILTRKSSSASVFGFALANVSGVYFFVEFIVGIIFILLEQEDIRAALVVQVIIAGIYAVLLLLNLIANERSAESIEKREAEIDYVRTACAIVKRISDKSTSRKTKKELERLYDAIHSSPTKSYPSVNVIEIEILEEIGKIESTVTDNSDAEVTNQVKKVSALVERRNDQLKRLHTGKASR